MTEGFILLHRKLRNNVLWPKNKPFTKMESWIDLLMMARFDKEPIEVLLGNEVVMCGRGQIVRSINTYQKRWNWGAQRVKSFFEILLKLNQIEKKTTSKTTIITICNYDSYQGKQQTDNKRIINEKQTDNKRITTKNKENKVNKENNINIDPKLFYETELKNANGCENEYQKLIDLLFGKGELESQLNGVLSIRDQITVPQFKQLLLLKKKTGKSMGDILTAIDNDKKYYKDKKSLYRTVRNWYNNTDKW